MPQNKPSDFSISVFGRFTYTPFASDVHYLVVFERTIFISKVMFVQIKQHVREQPDT